MAGDDESSGSGKEVAQKVGVDASVVEHRTISQYDITAADNPGILTTQVQLKGDNYDEWSRSFRRALRARKKYGFVDGTINRPEENSKLLEDWWANNSLITSWIMNTIEPSLRSSISDLDVAHDLWVDIKERFSTVNGTRIQQLKSEIASCKQKGLSIVAYYGRLKKLWEELADYEKVPKCRCGQCVCNLESEFRQEKEKEKVHQFLMGLDSVLYGTARSNILAQDPLPNLNRVYAIMVHEERMRTAALGSEEHQGGDAAAFAVKSMPAGGSPAAASSAESSVGSAAAVKAVGSGQHEASTGGLHLLRLGSNQVDVGPAIAVEGEDILQPTVMRLLDILIVVEEEVQIVVVAMDVEDWCGLMQL